MQFLNDISLSTDQLKTITDMGELLTPPEQVAIELDINEEIFLSCLTTVGNPIRIAYIKGMAKTEKVLRTAAIDSASAGSPAAMEQCMTFLRNITHKL
ncbi:MAG: hypothetical protein MJZ08_02550 [Bacteroidaceae bacterium]|nr:hypothetical protein [Bacteroidaceae bacterium]